MFVWASDISDISGEGVLCRSFLYSFKDLYKQIITIKTFENFLNLKLKNLKKTKKVFFKNSIYHKYIGPFFGVFYSWKYYLNDYKVLYVNYLPLWNFLIFLLLPPKTSLGPITGANYFGKINGLSQFIRVYIFPILFFISSIIIRLRYKKIIFSTSLLKKYFPDKKNIFFNFVLTLIKQNHYQNRRKKYDVIYYYRKHPTKNNLKLLNILQILKNKNYKICIVGDKIKNYNFIEKGYVTKQNIIKLINQSNIAIGSSENLYNLFVIEAINSGLHVIYDRKLTNYKSNLKLKQMISLNFNSKKDSIKKIENILKKKNKIKLKDFDKKFLEKLQNKFSKFLKDYLI
ncbi:MAG: hypothetical protein CMG74_04985 [Candidatus Marinimicrobia bacterium]|nr:hypothetical protein [Candidatus Neomarinimicrobiota bacterium]